MIDELKGMGIEVRNLSHRGEEAECINAEGVVAMLEAGMLDPSMGSLKVYRKALSRVQTEAPLLAPKLQIERAVCEMFKMMGVEFDRDYGPN